jgi:hypothetical protein
MKNGGDQALLSFTVIFPCFSQVLPMLVHYFHQEFSARSLEVPLPIQAVSGPFQGGN